MQRSCVLPWRLDNEAEGKCCCYGYDPRPGPTRAPTTVTRPSRRADARQQISSAAPVILQTALAIVDRDGCVTDCPSGASATPWPRSVMLYRHAPQQSRSARRRRRDRPRPTPRWTPPTLTAPPSCTPSRTTSAQLALTHPNVVPLLVTRPLATPLGQRPPGMLRPLEDVLALLTSAGFSRRRRPGHLPGALRLICTATSSTSSKRSSNAPRKPTTYCAWDCIDCRSPNSPGCASWHPCSLPTTGPPNSTVAWTSCSPG